MCAGADGHDRVAQGAVTATWIWHVAPAARLPPLNDTEPGFPFVAATEPLHWALAGVEATVIPVGKVSVKAIPVSAIAPACVFAIVIVSVEVPPLAIGFGLNALLMVTLGGVLTAVVVVLASHASPVALVQLVSPPPDRFTVLVPPDAPTAFNATLIGTVIV